MPDPTVSKLIRLKDATYAAAGVAAEPFSESALVESYGRLRSQALQVATERELGEEFEALFPELETVGGPPKHPRDSGQKAWQREAKVSAQRASTALHTLAGWLDGLIAFGRREGES